MKKIAYLSMRYDICAPTAIEKHLSSLHSLLLSHCDASLLYHSRTHRLPSFDTSDAQVWLKREDESGWGISGIKKRKYASLMPFLAQQGIAEVLLHGGVNSNNVVGLLQLLREYRIQPRIAADAKHAARAERLAGNALLFDLLADESLYASPSPAAFSIPEGTTCREALAGACTLALDIDESYDHIWIDSGTGMSAAALIWMLGAMERNTTVHVVQMADTATYFPEKLREIGVWFKELTALKNIQPAAWQVHTPATAKSFGSVNATLRGFIRALAHTEGVLADPIYSGKLLFTLREHLRTKPMQGRVLAIHSGGGMGIFSRM